MIFLNYYRNLILPPKKKKKCKTYFWTLKLEGFGWPIPCWYFHSQLTAVLSWGSSLSSTNKQTKRQNTEGCQCFGGLCSARSPQGKEFTQMWCWFAVMPMYGSIHNALPSSLSKSVLLNASLTLTYKLLLSLTCTWDNASSHKCRLVF